MKKHKSKAKTKYKLLYKQYIRYKNGNTEIITPKRYRKKAIEKYKFLDFCMKHKEPLRIECNEFKPYPNEVIT